MFRKEQINKPQSTTLAVVALTAGLLIGAGLHIQSTNDNDQSVSWYSWLTGNSISYDFHYLDLLELLYRSHDSNEQ